MSSLPGITRQDEEKRLQHTLEIAQRKVDANRQSVQALAEELHAMQEEFDENDKEAQTLWHNADARFKFVNQDLRRAEQARKKPYFGRIDFRDKKLKKDEVYYIGRSVIADNPAEPEVIDWRAPIASVYYDAALGDVSYSVKGEGKYDITLSRKRTYEIENDELKDFYDSDVVANDELLTKYLARNKKAVLGEIIATIQQEQNEVIRKKPQHNMIVQGAAGSGKTTVAMHRISYILYNYEQEFAPEDFYIVGSNQVLLNYITGVLPELNVYGVSQMTMEQLFVRLLYEDWDKSWQIKPVVKGVTPAVKGTLVWFKELENFCLRYEYRAIPREDVVIEKTGKVLLDRATIARLLKETKDLSRADKISRLTDYLMARLENELSGKYYSYTQPEKQKLKHYYETYFGKREWKGSVDLLSSYGTLRITPLAVDLFRICFAKGQCREFPKAAVTAAGDLRCTVRENPSLVEITAGYAQIRVDKKTGALTFLNTQGKILLTERSREPRQLGEKKNWSFFEWKKDEALIAGGIGAPKPLKIGNSAAYFSYGRADDRYPGLASSKGYEMIFPAGSRVLCCNIAMYGTYISMEETDIIDYYLRAK
ncbi:MAG: hypothetical protein V8Q20_10100 [Lachnospiraceae bacterium]